MHLVAVERALLLQRAVCTNVCGWGGDVRSNVGPIWNIHSVCNKIRPSKWYLGLQEIAPSFQEPVQAMSPADLKHQKALQNYCVHKKLHGGHGLG